MSSRVRILIEHEAHGPYKNSDACRILEAYWMERQKPQRRPLSGVQSLPFPPFPSEVAKWPRWKRAVWIAKKLGWKVRVFREPRGIRFKSSLFWLSAIACGIPYPRRKPVAKAQNRKNRPRLMRVRNPEPVNPQAGAAQQQMLNGNVFFNQAPVPVEEAARRAYAQWLGPFEINPGANLPEAGD